MVVLWVTVTFVLHTHARTSEFTYNYVDRVRLVENSLQNYKCPLRNSGWRHNRSISHLDLATSCPNAASGLAHWPNSRQLRHSRSLDYNQLQTGRCKENIDDIAEFYWRIDPEIEFYEDDEHEHEHEHNTPKLMPSKNTEQNSNFSRHKNNTEGHRHCRNHNYADDNYHSTDNIYQKKQQQQQQQQQRSQSRGQSGVIAPFDFDGEACSLRRSRSLAVIREETFSDLQITSANSSRRRSQLIPRARLVNRGFFQDRERLICCGNSKHYHHHHHNGYSNSSGEQDILSNGSGGGGGATTCDSHQHHLTHYHNHSHNHKHNQNQNQNHNHNKHNTCGNQQNRHPNIKHTQSCEIETEPTEDFYDNLKRLDELAVGFVREQLHPWHNDKSDLESLNSDYFKNSLHQKHEHQQHLDLEVLEHAVNLLAKDKPRIYLSRRQPPHSHIIERVGHGKHKSETPTNCGDSCPEHSQSSVFPETTTSNSDDQTDSPSLSEQEYDLTKIEEIFKKTQLEGDDESYELISLTTTRTHIETTEDEGGQGHGDDNENKNYNSPIPKKQVNKCTDSEFELESESTLRRSKAISENLEKLIAYDSVYLSSEEGSEITLIDDKQDSFENLHDTESLENNPEETSTLLHISIEDSYETNIEDQRNLTDEFENILEKELRHEKLINVQNSSTKSSEVPIYTRVLKVTHSQPGNSNSTSISVPIQVATSGVTSSAASKAKIQKVVERRKLKRHATTEAEVDVDETSHVDISEKLSHINAGSKNCKHQQSYSSETNYSPFAKLKRQATDSLYLSYTPKANLSENQYHSLPDVNIGQSLKVSECIDAELRSSYNYNRYQHVEVDRQQETRLLRTQNHNSNNSSTPCQELVTTEQIYDSIKRFGRAHQKARQLEYKELYKESRSEEKKITESQTKNTNNWSKELQNQEISSTSDKDIVTITTTKSADCVFENSNEKELEEKKTKNENIDIKGVDLVKEGSSNTDIKSIQAYDEQEKEAPAIEVANFSKQIEEKAKEIRECIQQKQQRQQNNRFYDIETDIVTANSCINKSDSNLIYSSGPDRTSPKITVNKFDNKNDTNQFRIIVTDTQNNIIEEDSIDGNCVESSTDTDTIKLDKETNKSEETVQEEKFETLPNHKTTNESIKRKRIVFTSNQSRLYSGNSSLKRAHSKPRRQPQNQLYIKAKGTPFVEGTCTGTSSGSVVSSHQLNTNQYHQSQHISCPKSKEHRVLGTQIYKARPIRVLSANESFRKMSRPQILHVVENKRKGECATTRSGSHHQTQDAECTEAENEYFKKVDAVRCYWSKLVREDQTEKEKHKHAPAQTIENHEEQMSTLAEIKRSSQRGETHVQQTTENVQPPERRHFILGANDEQIKNAPVHSNPDDFCSFMPSIEIVELDGDKKATIVSAVPPNTSQVDGELSNSEPQFDHIRYKVLKSQQLLRTNMTPRTKKEAQFDGLIQYLQDYSFQELLSNNNVVIVEPVRTKVEPPTTKKPKSQALQETTGSTENATDITGSAIAKSVKQNSNSSGLRRHFFYQPVRVNRELYEEELPNPDTVRNVRRFFEENILPQPGRGLLVRKNCEDNNESEKSGRECKYRFLTIDTSYGHGLKEEDEQQQQQQHEQHEQQQEIHKKRQSSNAVANGRKWDTASLSSGISSGDLSSPCECNDADTNATTKITHSNINKKQKKKQSSDSNNTKNDMKANIGPIGIAVAVVHPQEFRGVHVQDVVRRHNSNCIKETSNDLVRPRSAVYGSLGDSEYNRDIYDCPPEPRHYKMTQRKETEYEENDHNKNARNFRNNQNTDDDDDINVDTDEEYNEHDDEDLCESHYVSNDVLKKIRECGSTVTYYGGRIWQSSSPDSQRVRSPFGTQSGNNLGSNTQTIRTPRRVRHVETCSVCQPNECPKKNDIKTNFCKSSKNNKHHTENAKFGQSTDRTGKIDKADKADKTDKTSGIKFKLVKSNSCSSRLELAGAGDDEANNETEVVRRMVDRFENNNTMHGQKSSHEECVTINNQTAVKHSTINVENYDNRTNEQERYVAVHHTQNVTVNNHINVPQAAMAMAMTLSTTNGTGVEPFIERSQCNGQIYNLDKDESTKCLTQVANVKQNTNMAASDKDKTDFNAIFKGQQRQLNNEKNMEKVEVDKGNATKKIARNKNVDLAFTLVKNQQQQQKQKLPIHNKECENVGKNILNKNTIETEIEKDCSREKTETIIGTATTLAPNNSGTSVGTSVTKTLKSNLSQCNNSDSFKSTHENNFKTTKNSIASTSMTTSKKSNANSKYRTGMETAMATETDIEIEMYKKSNSERERENENQNENIEKGINSKSIKLGTKPTQIIVPVQIHHASDPIRCDVRSSALSKASDSSETKQHEFCLSTTSSTSSLIDKKVVQQYVANDKSLFERRKYDDIEFEEFEVFDPCKNYEKQQTENNNFNEQLETQQHQQHQQQTQQHAFQKCQSEIIKSKTLSNDYQANDDDDLMNSSETEDDGNETTGTANDSKYKSETDCYDSLDDKR